jgi:hypothetical protein
MVPLLIARFLRVVIGLDSSLVASKGRIQFSIRHLMILTFVVACLTAISKWLHPHLREDELLWILSAAGVFGLVGVLPVWFVLATRQPLRYSVGLVALGACVGYCFTRFWQIIDASALTAATAIQMMAVCASLLVVRSCGYRLMWLGPSRATDRSAESNAC